jgi:hypothetical protein
MKRKRRRANAEKRKQSNAEKLKRGNAENGRISSEYAGGKHFAS